MNDLEPLNELLTVDSIVEYPGDVADYIVELNMYDHGEVRMYYLKNLRTDWEIYGYIENEFDMNGCVLFKRK